MKRALIAAGLLLGVGLLAAPAQAQTGTARGKVLDAQGQPIPDVKVLIEFQGGITRKFETKTNKKGEYMQVGMQPGPYRFTASKDGYQPAVSDMQDLARRPDRDPRLQARDHGPGRGAAGQRRVGAARPVRRRRSIFRAPGKLDEAEAAYKAILEKAPDIPEVYQNLGSVYAAKKDVPAAEAAYLKGLELRPDSSDMATQLAKLYQENGQPDKAMAIMDEVGGRQPGRRQGPVQPGHLPPELRTRTRRRSPPSRPRSRPTRP